jgi:hypothetical protein
MRRLKTMRHDSNTCDSKRAIKKHATAFESMLQNKSMLETQKACSKTQQHAQKQKSKVLAIKHANIDIHAGKQLRPKSPQKHA